MILTRKQQIERTKRLMDIVVYLSSALDVGIAVLTTFSYFKLGDSTIALIPIEYMLTATVVLTAALGISLLYLKHYENVMLGFLNFYNTFKSGVSKFELTMPKLEDRPRYSYKPKSKWSFH